MTDSRHRKPAAPIPGPIPAEVLAALDAVYAALPNPHCRGLCADSCHNPTATAVERRRITDAGGPTLRPPILVAQLRREAPAHGGKLFGDHTRCPALSALGTCTVYADRPLLCRAFGAVATPNLTCDHGCQPPDPITFRQLLELMVQVETMSRAVTGEPVIPLPGDPNP